MYTGEDHIVVPAHLLCQDCSDSRIEERNGTVDPCGIGEQISFLSFPVVPRTDPGLPPPFLRQQDSFAIREKFSSVISQEQPRRHFTTGIHQGFRDQLFFRKLPRLHHPPGRLYGQTAPRLLTGQQMKYQSHIPDLPVDGIAQLLSGPFIIHRPHNHMSPTDSIA